MAASPSDSAYVTALEAEEEQATSSCSPFVAAQIELSKRHWSQMAEPSDGISMEEEAAIKLENKETFKTLEMHPEWGEFFFTTFNRDSEVWESMGSLELGEKFAEGAQAELFHAHVHWSDPEMNQEDDEDGTKWVVKVFKKGTLVRHLQQQWPEGLFQYTTKDFENTKLGKPPQVRYHSEVHCATLLEDGRFAFLMVKEDEDLRTLIDRKMKESDHGCGPFSKERGEEIMYRVAQGLNQLHSYGIVHRDLKASNVLVRTSRPSPKYLWCSVADFESSVGVVGTGFWRAPEILQACRERNVNEKPELFSKKADAYSYGMTCYEVLTGRVPFQDHPLSKECPLLTDLVINQHLRPEVPEYVNDWARELLESCWQFDPATRPSFVEILSFIEANSEVEYIQEEAAKRMVVVEEAIHEIPKFR
ncbi:hypothetical protein KC19_12G105400 [Ceratodon purpureus]|uniref:Protein kinase domain-containing protein n=1 Tax=Ceratodon purpureus TaxID=3225 RepID=A0A8T0G9S8_CERPU|nr:hypothetical protein KC19_12G105400 [Ceratodon purpureus]